MRYTYISKSMKEGEFIDSNGCHYDDAESLIMTGIFGFCGCVGRSPINIFIGIFEHLENNGKWDDLVNGHFNGSEGMAYIALTMLDNMGFIEHGYSIRNSWITESGKEIFHDLKELKKEIEEANLEN